LKARKEKLQAEAKKEQQLRDKLENFLDILQEELELSRKNEECMFLLLETHLKNK
jgi:hypothetical protein